MLEAFEEHLKCLWANSGEAFHRQIRARVGKKATLVLERKLKNLILLAPRLLAQAHKQGANPDVPSEIKKMTGFVLTYFYHPQDFLSEEDGALFGYLDDAYFAGVAYERILQSLIRADRALSKFDQDFLEQFGLIKRAVHLVIPDAARKIDQMVEEVERGKKGLFTEAFV